jgi:hypothetical protein
MVGGAHLDWNRRRERIPDGQHLALLVGQGDQLLSPPSFRTLFFVSIALFIIIKFSQAVLFIWALVYMFSGIWARAAYSWSRRRRWRLKRAPAAVTEPAPLDR